MPANDNAGIVLNYTLPLAQTPQQVAYWNKLQPVNRCATTDTYKRTMAASGTVFADNRAVYTLTARKPMGEQEANGQLIVAGLEKMLYPWFANPVTGTEISEAEIFFKNRGAVNKFATAAWSKVYQNGGRMPIDIYALPGGQTIKIADGKSVPIMSVEGVGALVSHLEPQFTTMYEPIMQATKAHLMYEQTGAQFAEFGLRGDNTLNNHVTLMHAVYVGGGFTLTSDDQAVFLFPEYFKDIGTVGHEWLNAFQRAGKTLLAAQEEAYTAFVNANQRSALLPDIVDTLHVGLPAVLDQIRRNEGNGKVILPRFDSGDVPEQCIAWKYMTLDAGIKKTGMIVEDGYTPRKAQQTKATYRAAGFDPADIFVGAGGYFKDGVLRDTISLAYKRGATEHDGVLEPNIKLSDTPGKESIPGRVRVYEQTRADGKKQLLVAQADECVDGVPLMQKVVDNGRIIYHEDLRVQHERANATWNRYETVVYSDLTQQLIDERRAERMQLVHATVQQQDLEQISMK